MLSLSTKSKPLALGTMPGVTVHYKALSVGERLTVAVTMGDDDERLEELRVESAALRPSIAHLLPAKGAGALDIATANAAILSTPEGRRMDRLRIESLACERRINEAMVLASVESIEGLEIDGEPATAAGFARLAENEALEEVADAVRRASFVSGDEAKN